MITKKVILITRIYKKKEERVVALSDIKAAEYIKQNKLNDMPKVSYYTSNVWLYE